MALFTYLGIYHGNTYTSHLIGPLTKREVFKWDLVDD